MGNTKKTGKKSHTFVFHEMSPLSKNKNKCTMINYRQFLRKCVTSNACYIIRLLQIRLSKVTLHQNTFQTSYAHKYTAKFINLNINKVSVS